MSETRSRSDRLRYALILELILISLFAPVAAHLLGRGVTQMGVLAAGMSLIAVVYTMAYNYLFDSLDIRLGNKPTERSLRGRMLHAALFEVTLVILCLPVVMWLTGFSILAAIGMDLVFTICAMILTLFYTLAYDKVFPLPSRPRSGEASFEDR